MPVTMTRYVDGSRSYSTYKLYTKDEITAQWDMFKQLHLKKMSKDEDVYVTLTVRCKEEAIVLIALMMRRTAALPNCFYYDDESKKLLANCTVSGRRFTDTRDTYLALGEMFLPDKNLKDMAYDPVGQELFKTDKETNSDTHEAPLTADNHTLNIDNLHKHMDNLSFMGYSGMESM